jgi:hypothetical protein
MQSHEDKNAKPLELGKVVAERHVALFKQDGSKVPVTMRIGKPFKVVESGDYRCPLQILGIGKGRVTAAWGEDPYVALRYALDYAGQVLDDVMRRENLGTRSRPDEPQPFRASWIWHHPVRDFKL